MSRGDTIYALIRSELVINEKKQITDSNNDRHNTINEIR